MKRLFKILCLFLFVSGCSGGSISDSKYEIVYTKGEVYTDNKEINNGQQITIAIVPKVINIPYFNAVEEGALEAGKDLGVHVIYAGPPLADPNLQIAIIKDLMKQEVDILAVSANDPEQVTPILLEAKKQGIKVITWDSDALPEARSFFINMVEPETLGRHLMDMLAWNTDEVGEFAIMTGSLSAANLNEWLKWIQIQQEAYYPNMKLVDIVANDDNPQKAYDSAIGLLEKHPNLKGIIGNSSVGPPAAAQAVKELQKIGQVAVVGLSPPTPMNKYLKEDSAQIVTLWSPKKLGYLTVALAKNAVKGIAPYDHQEINKVGKIRLIGDMVIMGEPIDFTKENVDQYDF